MLLSSFQESCFLLMIFEKLLLKGLLLHLLFLLSTWDGFDLDPETLKDLTDLLFL